MVKWSDTSDNVLRQPKILQIQHTYVISSQKIKKIKLFGPTLLRNFPLKMSDFLGIFKNVLTGFYCIVNKSPCRNSKRSHGIARSCSPLCTKRTYKILE
jgi:hypothetical protein